MSSSSTRRRAAARLSTALLALCALGAIRAAWAGCFEVRDAQYTRLRPLVSRNAKKALTVVNGLLAGLPAGTARTDPRRLAALYAVRADAYGELGLYVPSRASALKGLALVRGRTDPLRLALLSDYALSFREPAGMHKARTLLKSARAAQRPGSRNDICLRIVQGSVNLQQDRADLAARELTEAYLQSASPPLAEARMDAASLLAIALRRMGDFDQALGLIGEVIRWDAAHGSASNLAIDAYLQGQILRKMGHFRRALVSLRRARAISLSQGAQQGIAYADLRICQSELRLRRFTAARRNCDRAAPVFAAGKSAAMVKEAHTLLARIDLADGHAARALTVLNRVLTHDGKDMAAHEVPPVYLARARANAALGNYRNAYADLQRYLQLYSARNQTARMRLQEALEVRFHAKEEVERNAVLRRKLRAAAIQARRQRQLLHWIEIASIAGTLVIVLLSYILMAGRRHRRQLLRLANEDNLTGIPNRGHTAQLAAAALQSALARDRPLTVALLDFDHFKEINDQCGHAAGDHVLREFARLARGALRATDVLGRWGGEEFLLVLPDTTVGSALSSIERLRLLALGIVPCAGDPHESGPRVTFSAGLATTAEGARTLDEIIARADSALYEAKNAGRDLVRIDHESCRNAAEGAPM